MKCFLHIGTEKTATKTLQGFLHLNRNELLKRGFVYTRFAGSRNNRKLAVAAYDHDRRDDLTKTFGIRTSKDLKDFQFETARGMKAEIDNIVQRQSGSSIIFSSEYLQSRLTKDEEVHRLKEVLYELGFSEIFIVVYLRDPAEIANSLFSTSIKSGGKQEQPPSPKDPYFRNICNHRATIERFSSVFGEAAVQPRIFDATVFKNGSVIEDFLSAIDAPMEDVYVIPKDANRALSPTGLVILRQINERIPKFVNDSPNPLRPSLVRYLEKYFSDEKYVMSKQLYEQYDAEFQESNEYVRRKYFPNRQSLFVRDNRRDPSGSTLSSRDAKKMADLIADIWMKKNTGNSAKD